MPTLVVSVPLLARTEAWQSIKTNRSAILVVASRSIRLRLVARHTPVAEALAFECPNCGRRCCGLWIDDDSFALGCRRCLKVQRTHPANMPSTTFARKVVRLALQLKNIDRRLAVRGLNANLRRRLKRRQARLRAELEQALANRRALVEGRLQELLEELTDNAA